MTAALRFAVEGDLASVQIEVAILEDRLLRVKFRAPASRRGHHRLIHQGNDS
jgi:hypothetical protein